jgi:hypothetical protein
MPLSAVRTFSNPNEYFSGIQNLHVESFVERRSEFRAEPTRIDLHRWWIPRFNEHLPRVMELSVGVCPGVRQKNWEVGHRLPAGACWPPPDR